MKFIHVADVHASRERLPQTLSILKTLTERCKQGDIDFIAFAGDFWDSTITATKGSGFSDIIAAVRELEKHVYRIFFIYGTPSHEPSGSLDAFKSDKTFICSENSYKIEIVPCKNQNQKKTDIPAVTLFDLVLIPEPRRSNYITKSAKETDEIINSDIKTFIKSVDNRDKNTPRVVVYHGEVKGAVYQNGVSASSPTAIPKKLLQSLNADYYALGHIHMPQEVFPNAWYPGSACPKNFGEPHDGCYNLVEIKDGKTRVDRVSFGLPVYETFNVFFGDFTKTIADYSNKHIRLQFDCTKEQKKELNVKQIAEDIKSNTGAISVKLEPTVIESETTERSEVVKHKSITEKMSEYVKEKALIIPKYARELLKDIEDNTLAKLAYPQHSFELLSLSLRGAVGIRDGQHKEDFELDFERLEDGVVCLAGPCGKGKSTILENCHPYPCLLTREGTLKEHFYLKDSHRILIYKDENGLFYKISMLIDGKTATGKVSYYVETSKDRESWKSVPDVDGSLETYKKWVNDTFGSIDVFLRTAFFAKEKTKEATDISDTTKSERMELLSKLAGTEHLKNVSSIAKDLRKEVEKSADKIETEIDSYAHYEESIKENKEDIIKWTHELKGQKKTVSDLEKDVEELQKQDAEYQKVKAVAEANSVLYDQYKKEFDDKKERYECFEDVLENYELVEKYNEYSGQISRNVTKIVEYQKDITSKQKEISTLNEQISKLEKEFAEKEKKYNELESEIKIIKSQIVPIEKNCPTCGAPLSEEKIEQLTSVVKENEDKLKELKKEQSKFIVGEEKDWQLVPLKDKVKLYETDIDFINEAISSLTDEKDKAESFIKEHSDLKDYLNYSKEEIKKSIQKLSDELNDIQSKMDDIVDSESLEDVSEKLKDTEGKLKREQNHLVELNANIKAAEKENDKYAKALESVADKKAELLELKDKITAYNFIEDAFSNNGIPAIELRESAPEIADIANKILSDSYGNKFEIRFGSTSDIKVKRKANEDFNIIVTDTENFDEKTIDLVSSGERIWIKQALFYAFSIVQMNRTGFNFRTRLIDESDGSLDGALRPKYLKMVESAHKIANSRLTILISHSQEIKDIAQQIIEI